MLLMAFVLILVEIVSTAQKEVLVAHGQQIRQLRQKVKCSKKDLMITRRSDYESKS